MTSQTWAYDYLKHDLINIMFMFHVFGIDIWHLCPRSDKSFDIVYIIVIWGLGIIICIVPNLNHISHLNVVV